MEIESEWTARQREQKAIDDGERVFLVPEPALSAAEGLASKERPRTRATGGTVEDRFVEGHGFSRAE